METKYLLTTFRFSPKSSSLCCLDRGRGSPVLSPYRAGEAGVWMGRDGTLGSSLSIGAGFTSRNQRTPASGQRRSGHEVESRILYPKRKQQCLQFFYRMSGGPSDRLVVWIRRDDSTGSVLAGQGEDLSRYLVLRGD